MKNQETKSTEKWIQYAAKLTAHLQEIFEEESSNHIDLDEFEDSENATAFIHALATVMPAMFYSRLTNDEVDNLGFNHIANRLIMQFGKPETSEE
jgi:hypothetical protein